LVFELIGGTALFERESSLQFNFQNVWITIQWLAQNISFLFNFFECSNLASIFHAHSAIALMNSFRPRSDDLEGPVSVGPADNESQDCF
jgi:hypothetical protein